MRLPIAFALLASGYLTLLPGCMAGPRYVTCNNDAICRNAEDTRLRYCSRSRCVECVSQAQCRHGKVCKDGTCQAS